GGTDLSKSGLGPGSLHDQRDEVAFLGAGPFEQAGQGPVHGRAVAVLSPLAQVALLLALDLVADLEDVELTGDGAGVAVDADDLLLALLQGLLVLEGRIGDLGGEVTVVDTGEDARGHRADGVLGAAATTHVEDLGEDTLCLGLDLVGE